MKKVMKKQTYKLLVLTFFSFIACALYSCADENKIDIDVDTPPTVNGHTAEKILNSAVTEWNASSDQVITQMKDYNLVTPQKGDFLMYSNEDKTSHISYKFFNGNLYSTLVLMPEMTEDMNLGDMLNEYSFVGVLDSMDVYLNKNESTLVCAYEIVKDNVTFQAIGFTPINIDSEIVSTLYPTSGVINGHEWVDLGLSVKWATCNVGADSPEDYGGYYAWGETSTKSDYSWEKYKWANGDLTKYCTNRYMGTVDNLKALDSSDDVATVKWGSEWRMPTLKEINELLIECTQTPITHNGINGYKITASNGNSIFLPATGYYDGTRLKEQGTYGSYWSSSLYEDACEHASVLMIDLDRYGSTFCGTDLNYRSCGYSVRPVTE